MKTKHKARIIGTVVLFAGLCVLLLCCLPTSYPNVLYVCFGDSATAGLPDMAYPLDLEVFLEQSGWCEPEEEGEEGCVVNWGQAGDTVCTDGQGNCDTCWYGRLEDSIDPEANPVRFPNARTMLYWIGGNDLINYILTQNPTLEDIEITDPEQWERQIEHVRSRIVLGCIAGAVPAVKNLRPEMDIVLGTYYNIISHEDKKFSFPGEEEPRPFTPEEAAVANKYIHHFNQAVGSLEGPEVGVAHIDDLGLLCHDQEHPEDCYFDAIHPYGEGLRRIAGVWFQVITGLPSPEDEVAAAADWTVE